MIVDRLVQLVAAPAVAACALLGVPEVPAYAEAGGCAPGMVSDFNGDGRSDTVVADPYATVGGVSQAGRVIVLYGDADARVGEGSRGIVSQGSGSVGGSAESGDRFGSAMAVADLDCDGFSDLVVGTPLEDVGGQRDSGLVQFVWGGPASLGRARDSRQITQNDFSGYGQRVTGSDQFGYALDALEDVGQGGTGATSAYAVAIGVPGGNIAGRNDAGWVGVLHAFDGGPGKVAISQDTTGVPGSAETGDRFGSAVAINYFPSDRSQGDSDSDYIDVVVGVPNEDIGSTVDAGAITVVKDVYDYEFPGSLSITQDSPGVPGVVEAGDQFGRVLDTVMVGRTAWLAVGTPNEDLGRDADAGAVQLFVSSSVMITPRASLTQDTPGVSGVSERGDRFGSQLAFAAPSLGDAATRLAVAVPSEDADVVNQGVVQVFPVADLDAESTYSQVSPGVSGAPQAGDEFGETLAFVNGAAERALIVGVPDDGANPAGMVDVIPLRGGAPRAWVPGAGGVPLAGSSRFGGAVAGVPGGNT